jgi:adenine-specific DNA-methyltransferase
MDKLKMTSTGAVPSNVAKIAALFPNCVTERLDKDGHPEAVVDFDKLREELSEELVEGPAERYQFTWPDKRAANHLANTPTTMTLRPCEEESVGKDGTPGVFDSENLYIEGDNLDVLKVLRETYLGKVKMIYIDPPYNTGKDFVYNDDFASSYEEFAESCKVRDEDGNLTFDPKANGESNGRFHTDWLNMMYPRLKIARDLLSDDGVIFISMNDCEQANLRNLCNEIFGSFNFIAQLIWQQRKGGGNDSRFVASDHEYILIYVKSIVNQTNKWKIAQSEEYQKRYNLVDPDGNRFYWDTLVRNGLQNPIVLTLTAPNGENVTINSQWSKERVINGLQDGTVKFTQTTNGWSLHHKVYLKGGQVLRSLLIEQGTNKTACDEQIALFGKLYFDYPKPSSLIKCLAELVTDKDSLIIDFFSGSASTADAIMQINAEDGGHRKFIMVQLPEVTDEKSEARKAGYNTICEIGKERIRRAGRKIKEEVGLQGQDLDIGFRVLKLAESNMEDVFYTPDKISEGSLFVDNVKADRTSEDLLFQVMLELGIELSSPIEKKKINGKEVFSVRDGFLMATFDENVDEATITEIAQSEPVYFVMRDASAANDNVLDNFEQLFRHYSPDTIRRIL